MCWEVPLSAGPHSLPLCYSQDVGRSWECMPSAGGTLGTGDGGSKGTQETCDVFFSFNPFHSHFVDEDPGAVRLCCSW